MPMFDFNLEAMQAQLQSKFGRELDAIWQEIIDYRDKDLAGMSYKSRVSAVKKMFTGTSAKKFIACVWKNVGLSIKEVHIRSMFWGSFCTWMFFDKNGKDDQVGTFQIENILSGGYLSRYYLGLIGNEKHFSSEQLMKIASSYDVIRGAVKESMRVEMRKMFHSSIGFDVETAFFIEDQLPKNSGVSNFTAREITAVILHEIGHTLTLVEHAADGYARMASLNYLSTAFKNANADNINEVVKLSELVADKLSKAGDKKNADYLVSIGKKLKDDISSAGTAAKNEMVKNSIFGFLDTIFSFMGDVIVVPLTLLFGTSQSTRFNGKEQNIKFGDIPINRRMVTWQERKADEYAMTHGYGADIASGLRKLGAFMDRYGMSEKAIANLNMAEKLHKEIGFFEKLHLLSLAPAIASGGGYELYPEGVKRFRELLNITIQQLKAHSTDPDYVTKYIQDMDSIMKQIDNHSSRDEYIAKIYRGYDIFMRYCSLPSFIDYIVHGRIRRELEDLLNDANKIGNNLLTYYGFKLQQLAEK